MKRRTSSAHCQSPIARCHSRRSLVSLTALLAVLACQESGSGSPAEPAAPSQNNLIQTGEAASPDNTPADSEGTPRGMDNVRRTEEGGNRPTAVIDGSELGSTGSAESSGESENGGEPASSGEEVAPPLTDCVPNGRARNPLVSQIFTADPNAVVYGDRVYLYVSHDVDGQDGYDMVDYRAFSSDDMVNWQDHGTLIHSDSLPWAGNLYAPGACEKSGKYYLYMPNGGSSIGVAVADNPGGPFVDALGTALVTNQASRNTDVTWLFDPACFVDDDGQGYLYFGGGNDGASRDNGRVIRLGDDMISLADERATTVPIPRFFEALHMHKHEGTYFLQYSADFSMGAALEYLTSENPMTGFQYRGVLLPNSGINRNNNNHGSLVDFHDKTYLFYHARKLMQELGTDKVNNRSVAVQEMVLGANGTATPISMSTANTTVEQLKCLDGFAEVQAETLAGESGIEVEGNAGATVRVSQIDDGDWVGYSQVNFRTGATSLVAQIASANGGGTIDVRIDGCDDFTAEAGTSVGTCEVASTEGSGNFAALRCTIDETSGVHDLCLRFAGATSFELDSWHLE